jgi:glycosyltransferase involved in cell wall biosynthesis
VPEAVPPPAGDRILVFIPAYNCAPQVPRVLEQFRGVPAQWFEEVVVVDNGSRDDTVAAATAALPAVGARRAMVVRNDDNYNLGGSHKAVFAYAEREGFTHVVCLHGDDQGSILDVLPVLERGDHRRHDACLGARFTRGSRIRGYSLFRRVGNHVFNAVFSVALRRRVTDLGSGLNLFARAAFAGGAADRLPDDLHFNPYFLVSMVDRGLRLLFFPITWREEDQVSNVKMASQAMKTLQAAREFALDKPALRAGEHRTRPRDAYAFKVVASHNGAGAHLPRWTGAPAEPAAVPR